MYKPLFNKVLVEVDDKDAQWGKSSDASLGGEVYREGVLIEYGQLIPTGDHPFPIQVDVVGVFDKLRGKQIMWNEGHEAGTVFEENGKKYALIFWWDIIGVKEGL